MGATRAEFRDLARREIEIDPDGEIWEDDQMNDYISEANQEVQLALGLRLAEDEAGTHSFFTVVGTLEYSLPSNFGRMARDGIVKYDGNLMRETNKKKLLETSDLSTQGYPSLYYIEGNNIGFDLTPGNVKTVEIFFLQVVATPTESVGNAIPADLDLLIAKYVKYLCFNNTKNFRPAAADALVDYQNMLNRKRTLYTTRKKTDLTFGYQRR